MQVTISSMENTIFVSFFKKSLLGTAKPSVELLTKKTQDTTEETTKTYAKSSFN